MAQEYLDFLRQIEANEPAKLDAHIIVDNYATHKHPRVKRWLAARPRFHVHFTPTYASWLNQVEIWFSKIERDVIARGVFTSIRDLARKLMRYIKAYGKTPRPLRWKYSDVTKRIRPC